MVAGISLGVAASDPDPADITVRASDATSGPDAAAAAAATIEESKSVLARV